MGACCSSSSSSASTSDRFHDRPSTAAAAAAAPARARAAASAAAAGGGVNTAVDADDEQRAAFAKTLRLSQERPTRKYAKPRWRASSEGIASRQQFERMRFEFWDTAPAYGGAREAWTALRAAAEAPDIDTTRLLIEAAGLVVARPDLTVVYDERGARYELPKYVLSEPEDAADAWKPSGPPRGGGGGIAA